MRVREHARVEDVPGFDSGLEPPRRAHRERAERRQIEVPAARTVELIARGVAEADAGGLRERARVEPGAVGADLARDVIGPDQVGQVRVPRVAGVVARRVQAAAVRDHRERGATEGAKRPVDLPIGGKRLADAAVPVAALPRQRVDEAELKIVSAIKPCRPVVPPQFAWRVEAQRGRAVTVVTAFIHRLRQRVGALERKAMRHALAERHLHRVVARAQTVSP